MQAFELVDDLEKLGRYLRGKIHVTASLTLTDEMLAERIAAKGGKAKHRA